MITELTKDEFLAKVRELTENNQMTWTASRSRCRRIEIGSGDEIFVSPDLMDMPGDEYIPFRKQLELVMPAVDREKGFYW